MKKLLPILTVLALAASLAAQNVPPALMVRQGGKSVPLAISKVTVDARIFGRLAETKMTMVFHNPHARALAGDLYFPLPEGATVSGYALDVDDRMVDGVVVERTKARQVFEKEVRKGVDPGLVEWTKGNNFKTRVFPIPARGSRTVSVTYVTEIDELADGATWRLPLKFSKNVKQFAIRVAVVTPAAAPTVKANGPPGFGFAKKDESYVAEVTLDDAAPNEDLVIGLPGVDRQKVLVEAAPDGEVYFCIHDAPRRIVAEPGPPPARVTILWDVSASRGGKDRGRELALLKDFLKGLSLTVDVVLFRHKAIAPRRFVVADGDASAVLAALANVPYDGGTQMGCLTPPAGAAKPDFYLLFTDGLHNFGQAEPGSFAAPVYAISADAGADHAFLRHLAVTTGGQYFNLHRVSNKAVIGALGAKTFSFLSAKAAAGEIRETYPTMPTPVHGEATGRFTLVGKLKGDSAKVTLAYGLGAQPGVETTVTISRTDAVKGDLLRRFWAQRKLDELLVRPKLNAKAIVALGKTYGLVTPGTSLMVLETLGQYVEHRIAPPRSLPKMRNKWLAVMDARAAELKKTEAAKLNHVLALWNARVKWWAKEFKYPKGFKYKQTPTTRPANGQNIGRVDGSVRFLRAPSTASPAPPGPPAARDGMRRQTVTRVYDIRDLIFQVPNFLGPRINLDADAGNAQAGDVRRAGQPGIVIKAWDPKTPYIAALKKAGPARRFDVYMAQRAKYGRSPAFFLDCGGFFIKAGDVETGVQVLSNIAELELENAALLRVLAHKLAQIGRLDLAVSILEEVLRLRPEEPQSRRDLALVLARRAGRGGASPTADYRRAIELLAHVVMNRWDRFDEIEVIALMELNALLPKARAAGVTDIPLDKRLIKLLDLDVRIVLTWDADMTDIDLHVIEPSGERAFYSHNRTTIGGFVSRDFTGGYGPEEYILRRGMNGMYKIQVKYYGSSAAKLQGPVTVQVDVFTHYGRATQKRKSITVQLKETKDIITIGQIEF